MLNSFLYVNSRRKYISIPDKGPTQGLDDTTFTAEKRYSMKFYGELKEILKSFYYNGVKSYLSVKGVEIYKFNAKDSEIT